jgi:hypothetical protein
MGYRFLTAKKTKYAKGFTEANEEIRNFRFGDFKKGHANGKVTLGWFINFFSYRTLNLVQPGLIWFNLPDRLLETAKVKGSHALMRGRSFTRISLIITKPILATDKHKCSQIIGASKEAAHLRGARSESRSFAPGFALR